MKTEPFAVETFCLHQFRALGKTDSAKGGGGMSIKQTAMTMPEVSTAKAS